MRPLHLRVLTMEGTKARWDCAELRSYAMRRLLEGASRVEVRTEVARVHGIRPTTAELLRLVAHLDEQLDKLKRPGRYHR